MPGIDSFSFDADELRIAWSDQRNSRLAAIWLRDHCQGAECRDAHSGQRLINISDLPLDISIARVVQQQRGLVIEFSPDGHRSEFSSDWLLRNCYCLNRQQDDRSEAGKQLWRAESFKQGLPRFDYQQFCQQPASKLSALKSVKDAGFAILEAVPCKPGQVLKVIEEFGFVRETNYGPLFEVRSIVDANNLAYTNLGLGCHLDNPYRDPVPGLQLLHCLESSTSGGESILQDGFMAASILRQEKPQHFALLSQHWINFHFEDQQADLQARVPFIEVNDLGQVIKVRFNNRSIDTIKLAADLIRPFYAAYRHYAGILEREDLQLHFKLLPGELMLFDNTRILHARKPYSAAGTRHLQGAYSDLDGLYSRLNKLEQNA